MRARVDGHFAWLCWRSSSREDTQHAVTYREDLEEATRRAYDRYAIEVVERFGFCPWARSAREGDDVVVDVIFSTKHDDFGESLARMSALHDGPERIDIALFVYPLLDLDRLPFEDFVRRLRAACEAHLPPLDEFAMAAFHPSASVDLSHPDRLVPYVRRSPDPTLQLVRNRALSRIKGLTTGTEFLDLEQLTLESLNALTQPAPKAVRERIAEQNLATVSALGPAAIDAVLDDIFRQREAAHERLQERYGERGPRRIDPG
jgi:hypothetical protein